MTRAHEQEWHIEELPIERVCPDCREPRHADCFGSRSRRCDYCEEAE